MEKELEEIIMKQLASDELSEEEKAYFEEWYKESSHQKYFQELLKIHSGIMAYSVKDHVDREKAWRKVRPVRKISRIYEVLKYAVILLLPLCIGILLFTREREKTTTVYVEPIVKPGGKLAVLTLSTGKQVELSERVASMSEQGAKISNSTNNELVYKLVEDVTSTEDVYNTITVPRGGEYKLVLADGTTVWLNSDSYIRFPVTFSGDKRQVELRGEAYFEVSHDKHAPFIVNSKQIKTCVLGTKFNVRAREEENRVVTTLLQGLVRVDSPRTEENGYLLKPGQTLNVNTDTYQAELIEYNQPTDVLLWMKGKLEFKQHSLLEITNIMEKLYDIKFIYKDDALKSERFTGEFSTDSTADEILNVLMHTNHFSYKKDGRIIRVMKK